MIDAVRLQGPLGYEFRDPTLLESALTHRSGGPKNNERLEFLGDAVLGFVVADELFRLCPRDAESKLTMMRAALVRREALAGVGRQLGLSEYLRVGTGERKGGVIQRDSVLADAVEALLGAVLVDAGFDTARALVLRLFAVSIERVIAEGTFKDAKTQLQEHLQARARTLPTYRTVARDGSEGNFEYRVECRVVGMDGFGAGVDSDVRAAEQKAAAALLLLLRKPDAQEDEQQ